jgi:hypothetical protein
MRDVTARQSAAVGFGFGPPATLPTRLATPQLPSRSQGLPIGLAGPAPTQPTRLPTPRLSLRMRTALAPSPQAWQPTTTPSGAGGEQLFRPVQ